MKKLREFTKLDWYGWQGANEFQDGTVIAEGEQSTLIVCGSETNDGTAIISAYFGDDCSIWCFKSCESKECALEETEILIDLLDSEFDESKWRDFGFEIVY